jgi:hypothetical protein
MARSSPVEQAAFDLLISAVAGPAEMASLSHRVRRLGNMKEIFASMRESQASPSIPRLPSFAEFCRARKVPSFQIHGCSS